MKYLGIVIWLMMSVGVMGQTTHYVNALSATPVSPFTNWNTASLTITGAIAVSGNNATIVVSNGVYTHTGRYNFNSNRTYRSVNGPEYSEIDGLILMQNNSSISGFLIQNKTNAIRALGTNMVISNCWFYANRAILYGSASCISVDSGGQVDRFSVKNSIFAYNGGISGGWATTILGSYVHTGYVENCIFWFTQGQNYQGQDAFYSKIVNSIFIGNNDVYSPFWISSVLNCLFLGVTAPSSAAYGATPPVFANNLISYGSSYTTVSVATNVVNYKNTNNINHFLDLFLSSLTNTWTSSNTGSNFINIITNSPYYQDGYNQTTNMPARIFRGINTLKLGLRLNKFANVIDVGDSAYMGSISNDFYRNSRISGRKIDIGQCEYFDAPLSLPYGDWRPFYEALKKTFPKKDKAQVERINIDISTLATNSIGLEKGVWYRDGEILKIKE